MMELDQESQRSSDIISFIKSILQYRALPINYSSLRDLVHDSFHISKEPVEAIASEETFLNFLLAHSEDFTVKPDGSVLLVGGVEYAFPQAIDVVDSIAVSDDSYFGDREEYISNSDHESNDSDSSKDQLISRDATSNLLTNNRQRCTETIVVVSSLCVDSKNNESLSTSSSDSSAFFLSSDTNGLSSTTEHESGSSFESCEEHKSNVDSNDCLSSCFSDSPSYSSCSDS